MFKEIIVLAKSSKRGGYCIAGVDTETGEWIRPISDNSVKEGAVPREDIMYSNGKELEILDKVKIKIKSANPTESQPENYVYDSSEVWEKTGRSSLDSVLRFRGYDRVDKVFYNIGNSVTENEIGGQPSLLLLNVKNSYIFIRSFEDKKIQLNFEYNNQSYKYFKISDELIKYKYQDKIDGNYNYKDNLAVVFSLTDRYDKSNKYYKMAAQLFYDY